MGFGFIFWLGVLGIIAGVFWLLRSQPFASANGARSIRPVLDERYARGEISREEYIQKRVTSRPNDRLYKRVGKLLKPRTATLVTSPLPCE